MMASDLYVLSKPGSTPAPDGMVHPTGRLSDKLPQVRSGAPSAAVYSRLVEQERPIGAWRMEK